MKKIKLPNNKLTLVDDSDYEFLNQWRWHDYDGYVARTLYLGGGRKNARYKMVKMHRVIMANPEGYQIDHINGDKYDNRRCNLRLATNSQNQMNKKVPKNCSSGVTGVRWKKQADKWSALLIENGKRHHLGYFDTKEDAVSVRKQAEKHYFGEYAKQ